MTELQKIQSFLESLYYHEKSAGSSDKKDHFPFVTISRQAGAGGNSLADAIIQELKRKKEGVFQGWQKFNQELCKKVAEEPGMNVLMEPLLKYEYRSEIEGIMEEMIARTTPQEVVNKKIFNLIRNLAAFGRVVLVGRGGVCLTRDLPLGIHVRLVAPLEARIKRMSSLFELPYKKSKELVLEQDKSRARLMKHCFNRDIDDPLLYHAVWNTGAISIEEIAHLIVGMIEKRALVVNA